MFITFLCPQIKIPIYVDMKINVDSDILLNRTTVLEAHAALNTRSTPANVKRPVRWWECSFDSFLLNLEHSDVPLQHDNRQFRMLY